MFPTVLVAVHTAVPAMGNADTGGIMARTVRDLISGSRFQLWSVGVHPLKGLPDPMELFEVQEG
jgi:class 3 adenylate cyclase